MEVYPGTKPFFDMARGEVEATLLAIPPFSFPGVTARVFPLRASMDLLSSFCQRYLNVAPAEICRLQPYLPYVFLVILDYGQGVIQTANLGWVSQHEIFFAVPLQKWRRKRGRMVFDGWVLNTPFIFVDSAASLTTGREVYGWPKVLASLRPSLEEWLIDPRNPTRLLSLSVKGFGDRSDGTVPLLTLDHGLGQNPSFAPQDFTAVNPFETFARFTNGAWLTGVNLAALLLRSPFSGFGPRMGDERSGNVLFASLRQLSDFTRDPGVSVLTLKQFRDAGAPDEICYQSIVESRLTLDRLNHGGPLGLYNLLQGDVSGGFRIQLYDDPSFPIASSLGLQTVGRRTDGGRKVSLLEPIFPFWLSVDLTYGVGENLGWRMKDLPWYGRDNQVVGRSDAPYSFNTVAGAGHQEWSGPFVCPRFSCQVFPLRVYDKGRLESFIGQYLNLGEPYSFRRWGEYVYMAVSRSRVFSQARSALISQIAIYVPLLCHEGDRFRGVVMAKPFAFVDNPTFAMTMREVQGVPAIDATIETPAQSWLRQGPVLRMKTDVFSVVNAGMGSERRTLLEVVPAPCTRTSSSPTTEDEERNDEELLTQASKYFGTPFKLPVLTLKQFRDARDPDLACYQALILEPWTISAARPQPLETGAKIYIYQYPSLPLASTLGLVDSEQPPTPSPRKKRRALVDVLTPDTPFSIDLDITIELAHVLSRTAGHLPWIPQQGKGPLSPDLDQAIDEILKRGPQELFQVLLNRSAAEMGNAGGTSR